MKIELTSEQIDQVMIDELKWIVAFINPEVDNDWVVWKEAAKQLLKLYEVE